MTHRLFVKIKQVMAINSALQVDLSGQVCADSLGTSIYSGVGGQMDFVRGARVCLKVGARLVRYQPPPVAAKYRVLVRVRSPGAGVVDTRAHVHYIVTEYGVANLRAKSLSERAAELVRVAAPQFKRELAREARDIWGLVAHLTSFKTC